MKYKEFGKSPNERAPKPEDSESLACTLEATLNYDAQSFINGVVWARRNTPAPPLIRYCPECGHVGPLPDDVPACCPDSHHAYVPETFVEVLQRANGVVDRMLAGCERRVTGARLDSQMAKERAELLESLLSDVLKHWWPIVRSNTGSGDTTIAIFELRAEIKMILPPQ